MTSKFKYIGLIPTRGGYKADMALVKNGIVLQRFSADPDLIKILMAGVIEINDDSGLEDIKQFEDALEALEPESIFRVVHAGRSDIPSPVIH